MNDFINLDTDFVVTFVFFFGIRVLDIYLSIVVNCDCHPKQRSLLYLQVRNIHFSNSNKTYLL